MKPTLYIYIIKMDFYDSGRIFFGGGGNITVLADRSRYRGTDPVSDRW